ncbi:suppressor of fused domain protein [Granulicoccus phenolivorans]|uniref:suppressor of fused domain protein n=1 Tax=Granulicoccus phenolivorans TaxID=266854 RepID=UPI00040C6C61|nr:suppressor of fused domain protein [Granulicoccus phenolivorans]
MSDPGDEEFAPNGDPIYRHIDPIEGLTPAPRDKQRRRANEFHLRRYLGDEYITLSERRSWGITLDLHVFPPSQDYPHLTLVTAGMSDLPMAVPDGFEHARLELMIGLPAGWPGLDPINEAELDKEANFWPIRMLKDVARIPQTYDSFLAWGHTITDQDNMLFDDSAPFAAALIGPPLGYPPALMRATTPEGDTDYLAVFPITAAELAYKVTTPNGGDALLDRLSAAGISAVIDPSRGDVVLDTWAIHLLLGEPARHLGEVFGSVLPEPAAALAESAETEYVLPVAGTHVRLTLSPDPLEEPALAIDTAARGNSALSAAVAGHRSVVTLTSAVPSGNSSGPAEEASQLAGFLVTQMITAGGRVTAVWLPHQGHVCTPAELDRDIAAKRVEVTFRVHPLDPEHPDRGAVTRGLRAVGERDLFRTDDKTYAECAANLRAVVRQLRDSTDPIVEGRQVRYAWSRYQLADAVLPGTDMPAWQVVDQPRGRRFGRR